MAGVASNLVVGGSSPSGRANRNDAGNAAALSMAGVELTRPGESLWSEDLGLGAGTVLLAVLLSIGATGSPAQTIGPGDDATDSGSLRCHGTDRDRLELSEEAAYACLIAGEEIQHALLPGSAIARAVSAETPVVRLANAVITGGLNLSRERVHDPARLIDAVRFLPTPRARERAMPELQHVISTYQDLGEEPAGGNIVRSSINIESSVIEPSSRMDDGGRRSAIDAFAVKFVGRLSLTDVRLKGYGRFASAVFMQRTTFRRVIFEGTASFSRSWFVAGGRFEDVHFAKRLRFYGARFASKGWFVRTRFAANTTFESTRFCQGVSVWNSHFESGVDLQRVRVGASLRFRNSSVDGIANLQGAEVAGELEFTSNSPGSLTSFNRARVGRLTFGHRDASERVSGRVELEELRAGRVRIAYATFSDEVSLRRARIGVDPDLPSMWRTDEKVPSHLQAAPSRAACIRPAARREGESSGESPTDPEVEARAAPVLDLSELGFKAAVSLVGLRSEGPVRWSSVYFEAGADFADAAFSPSPGESQGAFFSVTHSRLGASSFDATMLPEAAGWVQAPPSAWMVSEGPWPLSQVYREFEWALRKDGHLGNANYFRYLGAEEHLQERWHCLRRDPNIPATRCPRPPGDWLGYSTYVASWFWGYAAGHGTRPFRVAGWGAALIVLFAGLYSCNAGLYRRRKDRAAVFDGQFRLRLLEFPHAYLRRGRRRHPHSRRLIRFGLPLRLSTVVLLKVGRRDIRVSDRYRRRVAHWLVALEWWLGVFVLAALPSLPTYVRHQHPLELV